MTVRVEVRVKVRVEARVKVWIMGEGEVDSSEVSSNASRAEVPPKPVGTGAASGGRPQPHARWQVREQTPEIPKSEHEWHCPCHRSLSEWLH